MLDNIILEEKKKLVYGYMKSEEYKPLKFKDMAAMLQVPKREREDLREVLENLIAEGKITMDVKGKFKLTSEEVVVGTFSGTAKGYGFVIVDGWPEDVFIPESATKGALHNDRVQIAISPERTGKRKEGKIVTICTRQGDLREIHQKAFGMFAILSFKDAVLRRPGSEDTRTPHFI